MHGTPQDPNTNSPIELDNNGDNQWRNRFKGQSMTREVIVNRIVRLGLQRPSKK